MGYQRQQELQARNTAIYFRTLAGETYRVVGRDYGLTRQRVQQIVGKRQRECPAIAEVSADLLRQATALASTGWGPAVGRAVELRQAAFALVTLTEKPDRRGLRGMHSAAALSAVSPDPAGAA